MIEYTNNFWLGIGIGTGVTLIILLLLKRFIARKPKVNLAELFAKMETASHHMHQAHKELNEVYGLFRQLEKVK